MYLKFDIFKSKLFKDSDYMCLNLRTFFTFSLWLHPQKYMPNQYPEHYSIKEKMLMIVIGIVSEIKRPLSLHIHPNHQYKLDIFI